MSRPCEANLLRIKEWEKKATATERKFGLPYTLAKCKECKGKKLEGNGSKVHIVHAEIRQEEETHMPTSVDRTAVLEAMERLSSQAVITRKMVLKEMGLPPFEIGKLSIMLRRMEKEGLIVQIPGKGSTSAVTIKMAAPEPVGGINPFSGEVEVATLPEPSLPEQDHEKGPPLSVVPPVKPPAICEIHGFPKKGGGCPECQKISGLQGKAAQMKARNLAQIILAKFPEFDSSWTPDIQKSWFDGFKKLIEILERERSFPAPSTAGISPPDQG